MLLVAHGSRDPRAAAVAEQLADAVRRELASAAGVARVALAHLDFTDPTVGAALTGLVAEGVREVAVVPLLFAPGYHVRVDLPAAVAEVRAGHPDLSVAIAEPLATEPEPGDVDLLLAALEARLPSTADHDAVVLASAGSSDPLSRSVIEALTDRWSVRLGLPVRAAYATGDGLRVDAALDRLRAQGAERVIVSSLFLAPGRLPEAVRRTALESGAASVTDPLGADSRLVRLVVRRADRAKAHSLLTH